MRSTSCCHTFNVGEVIEAAHPPPTDSRCSSGSVLELSDGGVLHLNLVCHRRAGLQNVPQKELDGHSVREDRDHLFFSGSSLFCFSPEQPVLDKVVHPLLHIFGGLGSGSVDWRNARCLINPILAVHFAQNIRRINFFADLGLPRPLALLHQLVGLLDPASGNTHLLKSQSCSAHAPFCRAGVDLVKLNANGLQPAPQGSGLRFPKSR
mmetsp:Transcript_10321/g.19513  ORF Transcript_10321/g.19513 Transcript_10321/m.19513 type:complete len:208 (+) Transcript_10321:229-852(+)